MATVETPDGKTIEVTSGGALRYYQREPGYKILDDDNTAEAVEEQSSTSGRGRRQAPADVSAEAPETDAVEPVTG